MSRLGMVAMLRGFGQGHLRRRSVFMRFRSSSNAPVTERAGWAALALVGVVLVVGIAALMMLGPDDRAGQVEQDWRVQRSLAGAQDPPAQARRIDGLVAFGAPAEAARSSAMSDESRSRSKRPVTIHVRPRLAGGGVPARVYATVTTEGEAYHSWLEVAVPDENGVATFIESFDRDWTRVGVLTVATSAGALAAAEDGRLLYELPSDQAGRVTLPTVDLGSEVRIADVGDLVLAPPLHMGTLRFRAARTDPFTVTLRLDDRSMLERPALSVGLPRTKRTVPAGDAELLFSTFGPARTWSAVVPAPDDRRPFHHEGTPGDVVDVEFERRRGLDATVDLVRHPRAARALIFGDDAAFSASSLDRDAFLARERAAVRALALPLPNRREGKAEIPLGRVPLIDRAFRIELWSLRDAAGQRQLLTSRTFSVAGGLVALTL